jgi:hypothetical protein
MRHSTVLLFIMVLQCGTGLVAGTKKNDTAFQQVNSKT